jgi:hypothetical protein
MFIVGLVLVSRLPNTRFKRRVASLLLYDQFVREILSNQSMSMVGIKSMDGDCCDLPCITRGSKQPLSDKAVADITDKRLGCVRLRDEPRLNRPAIRLDAAPCLSQPSARLMEEASALGDTERCGAAVASEHVDMGHAGKFTQCEMGKVQEEKASARHEGRLVVEGGIINANPRQATEGFPWSWDMVVSCVKMDFCD